MVYDEGVVSLLLFGSCVGCDQCVCVDVVSHSFQLFHNLMFSSVK